jgi:hypothetical protein
MLIAFRIEAQSLEDIIGFEDSVEDTVSSNKLFNFYSN